MWLLAIAAGSGGLQGVQPLRAPALAAIGVGLITENHCVKGRLIDIGSQTHDSDCYLMLRDLVPRGAASRSFPWLARGA